MSKLLVDRELLASLERLTGALGSGSGWVETSAKLRAILAKPAEAEVVDFGFDDRSVKVSQEAYSIFLEREQHRLAALSAVTAERDRLLAEVETLRKVIRAALYYVPEHKHDLREIMSAAMAAKEA